MFICKQRPWFRFCVFRSREQSVSLFVAPTATKQSSEILGIPRQTGVTVWWNITTVKAQQILLAESSLQVTVILNVSALHLLLNSGINLKRITEQLHDVSTYVFWNPQIFAGNHQSVWQLIQSTSYCVSRPRKLRGPDGNAWRDGFWPAGRMLDTPAGLSALCCHVRLAMTAERSQVVLLVQ